MASPEEQPRGGMSNSLNKRELRTSKEIKKYNIAFILVKDPKDPDHSCILVLDKINDVVMGKSEEISNAEQLSVTGPLEQWQVQVRERPNGVREKMYYHPNAPKTFRSLVEVSKYIKLAIDPKGELGQIRVHYEKSKKPRSEKNMVEILQTFEEFLQANNISQSIHPSSNTEESPEAIAEMIGELLDKENAFSGSNSSKVDAPVVEAGADDLGTDNNTNVVKEP